MNHCDLDRRPSAATRRAIREWMLSVLGFGDLVRCWHCADLLSNERLELDRIDPDGAYTKRNLQPSCGPCNRKRRRAPKRKLAA